jgi:hypothetical protein
MDFAGKKLRRRTQGRKMIGNKICSPKTFPCLFRLGRNRRDP